MSEARDTIRALHVDDDPQFANLATTLLEREDDRFDTETATSVDDGLRLLVEDDFDCIVSDHDMPGRDGIEFLEAVREDHPDLPFILYTGKGSEEVASEAISKEATDYLQKGSGTEQYELLANRVRNAVKQYRSTQQAKRTRRRLQRLAESTSDCVWMFDRDWDELLFISGYEAVWDRPAEAIRDDPRDFLNGVHPDDRPLARDAMERMSNGESIDIEYRILRGDGESGWVWVQGEPVFDDDGSVRSVVGFTQDVTDRKQREQELERYERIVQNLPVGVFRTTPDGEFVDVNEQYVSLLDAGSKRDLADVEAREFWADPDDRRALLSQLEQDGIVEGREVEVETTDGTSKWIETTLRVTEEDGDRYLDGVAHDVTKRRERRQRLEQSETMFENAQDALFLVDVAEEFTVERVNPAYEEATGISNDAVSGQTPREILGDEQGAEIEQKYRTCVERKTRLEYEEVLSIDSEQTYWETRIAPVLIDGDVEKIVGATRDITERKEREQKLELVETLFEHTEECQFIVDVAGGEFELRHANEYYRRTVGLSPSEPVTGQTPTELFGETGGRAVLERYRECVETREPVTYTAELPVSGETATYRTILTPVVTEEEVTHVVGAARDVTERERRREQLVALNERSQMLMTADTSEEIAEIGVEAARETLGLEASSIHLHDTEQSALVPVAATAALHGLIGDPPVFTSGDSIAWRVYERGEAQAVDDVRDDPDVYNPETPIRSELYFPLDDHGILLAGSPTPGSFGEQDVTLGRILAANISSALEQVTKSERLRTREEMLTRQNERLEEFTSIVSHDLRNPLNVAEARLQLAEEECESDQLAHVGRALRRMDTLIENLLTMAREGEIVTDLDPVDVAAMAEECWTNVETADATLVTDTDRTVYADRNRLKQVFENLVRNAVEHGSTGNRNAPRSGDAVEHGDSAVTVVVGELDAGFYVEDDGPGIPPGERDDVFEAGYSTADEGTGFGLSIVEQVVEAHGWSVRATESSDGGARFEVTGVEFAR